MGGQKGDFRGRVYIIMTDSLCCMAETNIKKSNFPPIKKLCVFFFKKSVSLVHWYLWFISRSSEIILMDSYTDSCLSAVVWGFVP